MERSSDCALYLHPGTGWGSSACGGMTLARSKSHYTGRCGVQRPEARGSTPATSTNSARSARAAETRSRFDRAFRGFVHPSEIWCSRGIVPRSVQTTPPSPRLRRAAAVHASHPGKDSPATTIRWDAKRAWFAPHRRRPPEITSWRRNRRSQAVVHGRGAFSRCRNRSGAQPELRVRETSRPRHRSGIGRFGSE